MFKLSLHFYILKRNLLQIGKVKRNLTKKELKPKIGEKTVRQGHWP